jgi:hypothetical protein
MALFRWLSDYPTWDLSSNLQGAFSQLGLVINEEISNDFQLYACDRPSADLKPESQVKVLVSWTNRTANELQVQVISDEPLLRAGTRCEQVAKALHQLLSPQPTGSVLA